MVDHKIRINLTYEAKVERAMKKIQELNRQLEKGGQTKEAYDKRLENLRKGVTKPIFQEAQKRLEINKSQKTNIKQTKTQQLEQKKFNKQFKSFANNITSFSVSLPLMFGFQSISQGLKSLIQPSLDLVGATELYNDYLSLKYIDTGLDELEKNVMLMDELGETSRYATEGSDILSAASAAEAIEYAAQWANIGIAIGTAGGEIGRMTGAIAGLTLATNLTSQAFDSLEGIQTVTFMGLSSATANYIGGPLADLAEALGVDIPSAAEITYRKMHQLFEDGKIDAKSYTDYLEGLDPEILATLAKDPDTYQALLDDIKALEDTTIEIPYKFVKAKEIATTKSKVEEAREIFSTVVGALISPADSFTPGKKYDPGYNIVKGVTHATDAVSALFGGSYDTGGVIPGPIGAPTPILAHGGETVLPTHKEDVGGFGNQSIVINISGVSSPNDVQRAIDNSILQLKTEIRRLN